MSDIRTEHPGYHGVVMGLSVPWYMGLGAVLTFMPVKHLIGLNLPLITSTVPLRVWGVVYMALGLAIATCASVPRIPHRYVRFLLGLGFVFTNFWLINFIVSAFTGHLEALSRAPAWATVVLVEYQTIIEPEVNPATLRGHRAHTPGERRAGVERRKRPR